MRRPLPRINGSRLALPVPVFLLRLREGAASNHQGIQVLDEMLNHVPLVIRVTMEPPNLGAVHVVGSENDRLEPLPAFHEPAQAERQKAIQPSRRYESRD